MHIHYRVITKYKPQHDNSSLREHTYKYAFVYCWGSVAAGCGDAGLSDGLPCNGG